jgi:heme A synthase
MLVEFSHRLTSGLAIVAVVALFVWVWRACPSGHRARRGVALSLFFLLTEAGVGAALVLFRLVADNASTARALFMAVHLVNTFVLLGFLSLTAHWLSGGAAVRPARRPGAALVFGATTVALLLVATSGAIAALGNTLYPSSSLEDALRADFSTASHVVIRLRVAHPALAIAVGLALIFGTPRLSSGTPDTRERIAGRAVVALAATQLAAGLLSVILLAPVWMQLLHLFLADALWIAFVVFSASALADEPARAHTLAHPARTAPA